MRISRSHLANIANGRRSSSGATVAVVIPKGSYLEAELRPSGHFVGDALTGADMMLSFPAEIAVMQGQGASYPKLAAFVAAIHARPAWQVAREKGGAYYGY